MSLSKNIHVIKVKYFYFFSNMNLFIIIIFFKEIIDKNKNTRSQELDTRDKNFVDTTGIHDYYFKCIFLN